MTGHHRVGSLSRLIAPRHHNVGVICLEWLGDNIRKRQLLTLQFYCVVAQQRMNGKSETAQIVELQNGL